MLMQWADDVAKVFTGALWVHQPVEELHDGWVDPQPSRGMLAHCPFFVQGDISPWAAALMVHLGCFSRQVGLWASGP